MTAATSGPLSCRRKGPLRGTLSVPGDKSVSHRSLLFGALSTGETRVTGLLDAEDVHSTRKAVEALGATVRLVPGPPSPRLSPDLHRPAERGWGGGEAGLGRGTEGAEVVVVPPEKLREPGDIIDCGNSGTSLRLLTGVLSGIPGLSVLTGDASLRRRPVRRVIDPLRKMGANLSARDGDRLPPVVVRGGALRGADHVLAVASAQVKSACLLAGLFAEGETSVTEPERSRDHTERMLRGMGVPVRTDGLTVRISASRPRGGRVDVPGDISSAAFFLCGAAALPGSEVTVRGMGTNPTRTGLLDVLAAMGARVTLAGERELAGEPRADVTVAAGELRGTEIGGALVPRLIDELPVVMVMATQARGRTVIRDAKELRVKESDRLAAMGETLAAAGAKIELFEDGCAIEGPTRLRGVTVRTRLDHRIAMSMAIAQLFTDGDEVILDDVACVATSFPSFFDLLDSVADLPRGAR